MIDLINKVNCVNRSKWGNAEARTLRFQDVSLQRKLSPLVGPFWRVTYSLAYRYETWDLQILNQGTYFWPAGTAESARNVTVKSTNKKDGSGTPIVVNLTSTGGFLAQGNPPTYTRIQFYREIEFANTFQFVPP